MRGYVGIIDGNWYRILADLPEGDRAEVNFWRPGGGGFAALKVGEPFFFKTHAPHNRVVGGGFFSGSFPLPASEAWDMLGPANGVGSLPEMLLRFADGESEAVARFQVQLAEWLPRLFYGAVAMWMAYQILTGSAFNPHVPDALS